MEDLGIARRRMRASRLIGDRFEGAREVVRWHLAMQAQDYAPATWSVGQRSRGVRAEDLDAALAEGTIVRTHVLRPTWHLVAAEDVRWLLPLTGPRVHQANAGRYRDLGLDARTRTRCERVIERTLEGGNRLTREEIGAVLDRAGIDREGQRMPYILLHCELEGLIASGGLSGKRQTYALLNENERVAGGGPFDREGALIETVRSYLRSHGPATVKDISWWSGLTIADIRRALDALGSEAERETHDGLTFWAAADAADDPSRDRRVQILQAYDEMVVGYTESRWFGDPRGERVSAAWREPGRPGGALLFGSAIAGLWSRRVDRASIRIEAHLFEPRRHGLAAAVERAVEEHSSFFDLPVTLEVRPL